VPEDIIEPFGALVGSLISEAPMGDLDFEPEVFDATRIRADEKVLEASGRIKYTTVALTPEDDVVAYSELAVPSYDPGRAYQWGTLVRPEHRGNRLGMATKVHNLRRFQEQEPGRALLYTYNAVGNTHMIGVNDAMGFRPVQRLGEFQKKL
jgi:GNAT superfamily N-acetyltransferase